MRGLPRTNIITSGVAISWVVDCTLLWCWYLGLSGEGACARGREAPWAMARSGAGGLSGHSGLGSLMASRKIV